MELGACISKGRTATDFACPSAAPALEAGIVTKKRRPSRNMLKIFVNDQVVCPIIISLLSIEYE
jgi:hypothetical protein